jgi:hypothetical protein
MESIIFVIAGAFIGGGVLGFALCNHIHKTAASTPSPTITH